MKKFKTRNKKIFIRNIVIVILTFILFIFISLITLNKSHSKLVNYLTKDFDSNEVSINIITSNLDKLLDTYSFKEKNNIIKK